MSPDAVHFKRACHDRVIPSIMERLPDVRSNILLILISIYITCMVLKESSRAWLIEYEHVETCGKGISTIERKEKNRRTNLNLEWIRSLIVEMSS